MATTKLNKELKDPVYRRFVPDQVLTASQLNDVIDHFECQDRFTRICLNGVGIACGLEVKYSKNRSIEVSKGCAVTTDGDLISFKGTKYTKVRPFTDSEAKYDRFVGVPLLELVPDKTEGESNVQAIGSVQDLENKVVVLYLEYFCKEETPCTSTNCDTQGEGQTSKIRILLIAKEDAKLISNKDNDPIFDKHNNTKKFIALPEIDVKRVVLLNTYLTTSSREEVISSNSNTANYFRLKDSYRKAIQNNAVLTQLKEGISKLFTDFEALLNTSEIGAKATTINKKIDTLFNLNIKDLPIDIQYRYDLLKDLVATYNEIKCLIHDLRVACCPDINSFPKHLLLAELDPVESYLQCRHLFYPSPIIPHGKEKLEEISALILRLHFMVNEYQIPQSSLVPIKVTPSKNGDKSLSDRAIPYYYKTSAKLVENWDYKKTKKRSAEENLGYQTANLSKRDAIQNPLDYNIDTHDFYRIEGHLGKDYRTAISDLDQLKADKGLAFDIKVLSIDETLDSIDPEEFECEFEDLNAVLKAWRAEQNCLNAGISKFFSGFSLKNQGAHKFYKLSARKVSGIDSDTLEVRDTVVTSRTGSASRSITDLLSPGSGLARGATALDTAAIKSGFAQFGGQKLLYREDTVVLDNLETDEDVLGNIVEKAMREKPEGSAEDIDAIVNAAIDKDPEIATWDNDIKEVVIDYPSRILAATKVATRFIPNNVSEMTLERVDNYNKTVKNLCSRVETFKKKMTSLLFQPNTSYIRTGHEQQYALLLNQLSVNCCTTEKMKVLLAEIQERKLKILEQKLLSKFVEKHSGLEHLGGVKPGGTFVMVYKGKTKPQTGRTNLFAENILSEAVLKTNLDLFRTSAKTTAANIAAIRNLESAATAKALAAGPFGGIDITKINPGLGNKVLSPELLDILLGNFRLPPIANVTELTVVADFALPYICCSDCSPIAFVVPKTPISLRLPVDFVCFDKDVDTNPVRFEVSPADGIVSADVAEGLNGGVIQKDGNFFFDASIISAELFGKEIGFTVNGQFTDAKITVFRKPEFNFTPSEPRFLRNSATVDFTTTLEDDSLTGVLYFWDFGDGTDSNVKNPSHRYTMDLGDDNTQTVKVSLTVTNAKCSHTVEQNIKFEPIIVQIKIDPEVCVSSATGQNVPFEVIPNDGKVKLMKQVEKLEIKNKNLVFQKGFKTFNQPIKFIVNGEKVDAQVIARTQPEASIVLATKRPTLSVGANSVFVQFRLKNLNDFKEADHNFKWEFGDGKTSTLKEPRHPYERPKPNAIVDNIYTVTAKLSVVSKVCKTTVFTTPVNIIIDRLI